jgi:hypothetical protein
MNWAATPLPFSGPRPVRDVPPAMPENYHEILQAVEMVVQGRTTVKLVRDISGPNFIIFSQLRALCVSVVKFPSVLSQAPMGGDVKMA